MSPCIRLDKNEKNPLDYAAMNGKTEVIRLLLEALSHSATTSDVIIASVKKALYLALRGNQGNAFRALAIKFMENWDNVEIIQEKNKLLMGTPRSSDDVPTEDFEALNKKLMSAIRQDQEGIVRLNEFLASKQMI
ncbi:uncharacterized protein LOC113332386 [Papaver somniferum]|uniref:uncharacterized protein LOC113332386 n=1 Tax=Papaver somniferum TaxID=3469 RepID=UPI000E6F7654|nr:uncharacterized protein LOC113332386 [Papaver somniferum]